MDDELVMYDWNNIENIVQYCVKCNVWQRNDLFDWCEENIEKHSSRPFDPNWRWDFGNGPNGTMIYTFRYPEDAMAFKLTWG